MKFIDCTGPSTGRCAKSPVICTSGAEPSPNISSHRRRPPLPVSARASWIPSSHYRRVPRAGSACPCHSDRTPAARLQRWSEHSERALARSARTGQRPACLRAHGAGTRRTPSGAGFSQEGHRFGDSEREGFAARGMAHAIVVLAVHPEDCCRSSEVVFRSEPRIAIDHSLQISSRTIYALNEEPRFCGTA